jgi:archaellum component FlaC
MTSETDQLVLEALRGLRDEFQGVRAQVTSLQATVGSVSQDVASVRDEMSHLRSRMNEFAEKTADGFHVLREELIEEIHALREETREALRVVKVEVEEVRDDVKDVRLATVKNGLSIEHLDERVEMLRESTMTSLGFSAQVNLQQKKLAKQLTELSARVERLEKSK